MPVFDAVHRDTGTTLSVTLIDNQSEAPPSANLSSAQLRFQVTGRSVRERTMTVTDAANWIATYQFTTDDLEGEIGPGGVATMVYEVVGTDTNGDTLTTLDPQVLRLRKRLPNPIIPRPYDVSP